MDTEFKPAGEGLRKSRVDYTTDQLQILEKAYAWGNGSSLKPFTISGFAGTGKTTVTRDIVRNLNGTIAVTAPTHKAVRIASSQIDREGRTIQKLLGLRPNTDLEHFDVNNPQFDPLATPTIKDYKYVIVDEASMINKGLYKLLLSESAQYGTKIIFVGKWIADIKAA